MPPLLKHYILSLLHFHLVEEERAVCPCRGSEDAKHYLLPTHCLLYSGSSSSLSLHFCFLLLARILRAQ